MKKHIVIDARRINTSTGHYAKRLIDTLQELDKVNRYTVVVLEKEKDFYTPANPNFTIVTSRADHYTFAEQLSLAGELRRLKPDLVHFTMPQQPLLWFGKRITTVHDTTLIRYENLDQNIILYKLRKFIFSLLLRNVIARSRFVLSPSNYVRNDLDEWTGHRYSKKLLATPLAADMLDSPPELVKTLEGKSYIFFVGNAFPYKNVGAIVEAFSLVKQTHPELHLVLAGKRDFFYEQIEKQVKDNHINDVHILGYISDGQKRWIMQHAKAYVVASLSEGFHMPLHEALHEDCPVISSNATCLPEVGGDAALYFDPHNTIELADKIKQVLEDKKLREALIKKGKAQVKRFSWQKTARLTKETYDKVLGD